MNPQPNETSRSIARGPRSAVRMFADFVRAGEWWDFKFVPLLMIFYATALHIGASISSLAFALLTLFAALLPGAVYVSLLNDLTDIESDSLAGKKNRVATCGASRSIVVIAICIFIGLAFLFLWRDNVFLFVVYLCAWISFTLYSVPPIRLKARGFLGAGADAAGSNLFPALLAAGVAAHGAGYVLDLFWIVCVAAWAFGYGLRGILWHQIGDYSADKISNVGTFVQRVGPRKAVWIGTFIVLPMEVVAITLMLLHLQSIAGFIAAALYAWFAHARLDPFEMTITIVEPKPRSALLGQEYYDLFLPVALLVASSIRHSQDVVILAAHLLVFPRRPVQLVVDIINIVKILRSR